jgi:rhamnulokinase
MAAAVKTKCANFVAFDLGADSGRAVVGQFDGDRLALTELHRFPNGPTKVLGHLHWDVLRLFAEMKTALGLYVKQYGKELAGIGVDTWGVDFALLDAQGNLLSNPYHYRDIRTEGMYQEAFKRVPREEIFARTGIQFMEINTLYQLLSMALSKSPLLDAADKLLMMPDLLNYWLTGRKVCEFTEATTSQFYDPRAKGWSKALFQKLGLPERILAEIVPPGTVLGPLYASVAEEVGLGAVPVIAPACHDTGSAVAAVPAVGRNFAYISSGTWSLLGTEVKEPVITPQSLAYNFTNEGGICGTFRFLKNIMGLWLVQESRRAWTRAGRSYSYDELDALAARERPFLSLVEPDDPLFLRPGDMPARIREYCQRTGQPAPESEGAVVRCAMESLALKYRWGINGLEDTMGRRIESINIVGGGARDKFLNQLAADATGRPVIAGPFEATAIGNLLMQALASGYIASLEEGREIVRHSFDVTTYEPKETAKWEEPYERFLQLTKS